MVNKFDFSDAQLNWRNFPGFKMENAKNMASDKAGASVDDDEDWFFPQPPVSEHINIPMPSDFRIVDHPSIVVRRWRKKGIKSDDRLSFNAEDIFISLDEFNDYDDFVEYLDKFIFLPNYFTKVVKANNCDADDAAKILRDKDSFDYIMEAYKSCL